MKIFKGALFLLLFVYAVGIIPALVAAHGVAAMVYWRGRIYWMWLLFFGFAGGFLGAGLMIFWGNGSSGLDRMPGTGVFLGLCGLLKSVLFMPFMWRMKVVGSARPQTIATSL